MLPNDRILELGQLRDLVESARSLNRATGALDRLEALHESAKLLLMADFPTGRLSFIQFIGQQSAQGATWPRARRDQLLQLQKLMDGLVLLNAAPGALATLRAVEATAAQLIAAPDDGDEPSFIQFLVERLNNGDGFTVGQRVRLVPTQGGHQKERHGEVVRLTSTQVMVRPGDASREIAFRLSDGMPVRKLDQQFPCYKAVAS